MLYIPLRISTDVNITVTNTATPLYTLMDTASTLDNAQTYYDQAHANAVMITAEGGDIRYLVGTDPTASDGTLISKGTTWYLPGVELNEMRLISTSENVAVTVVPYLSEKGESPCMIAYDVTIEAVLPLPDGAATSANQTNGNQKSQIVDENNRSAIIDALSHTQVVTEFDHHQLHIGNHFNYSDSNQLDSGNSQDYLLTTPDTTKWCHILFEFDGSAITQFDIFEDSDKTGTTLQTSFNNNRNSLTTAGFVIHKGVSGGTTDGTKIFTYKGGSSTNQSKGESGVRGDSERILKQNTKYIVRITSGTNSNLTNLRLFWYEHTSLT